MPDPHLGTPCGAPPQHGHQGTVMGQWPWTQSDEFRARVQRAGPGSVVGPLFARNHGHEFLLQYATSIVRTSLQMPQQPLRTTDFSFSLQGHEAEPGPTSTAIRRWFLSRQLTSNDVPRIELECVFFDASQTDALYVEATYTLTTAIGDEAIWGRWRLTAKVAYPLTLLVAFEAAVVEASARCRMGTARQRGSPDEKIIMQLMCHDCLCARAMLHLGFLPKTSPVSPPCFCE